MTGTNAIELIPGRYQTIREYDGQRVVTLKDIDTVHERAEGTARKRFNANKKRFINGTDYFVRKTDEAKEEFGITAPSGLILITESGYLMLVKSFTDDLAWEVQRALVNTYFRAKAEPVPESMPEGDAIPLVNVEYIRSAAIIASCKRDTLPLVIDQLRRSGLTVPEVSGITEKSEAAEYISRAMERGMTYRKLAELTGLHTAQIWRIKTGRSRPDAERTALIVGVITEAFPDIRI